MRMKKLALVIISICISLLYGELLVRASGYNFTTYSWQWAITEYFDLHPQRIYMLSKGAQTKENTFENIDIFGFRYDPADGNAKPTNTSVFMFGDSFVYGHVMNDDETFPYVVQSYLRQRGSTVDIVNAGVPGYGTDQSYLYIREVMSVYHPDTIIWNINTNDIGDSNDACLFIQSGGTYRHLPVWLQTLYLQGFVVRKTVPVIRNSHLVNMLLTRLQNGHDRYTLGCTLPIDREEEITSRALEKLRYFIREIEKVAEEEHVRVIYTLLPVEYYFNISEFPDNVMDMERYFLLKYELSRF